jgi:LmbE family N-acetylglucosaminyl deacetylase
MRSLSLIRSAGPLRVACLGAHSDDIEIGCAGTIRRWIDESPAVEILWAVFCTDAARAAEARASAEALAAGALRLDVVIGEFRDAHLPSQAAEAKTFASQLRSRLEPDVVLTHRLEDRHQDHRAVAEITWQTWRDHVVLEYEIPKYEGDLGQPNVYVPLDERQRTRKIGHLMAHFESQRSKSWFSDGTFDAVMRLRGIECRAPSGFAEAFHARKLVL